MPHSRESAIKKLEKAWKSPRIGKRGKNKKTIAKENAAKEYERRLLESFGEIIEVHKESALIAGKGGYLDRKEALARVMGPVPEKVEVETNKPIQIEMTVRNAIKKIYGGKKVKPERSG